MRRMHADEIDVDAALVRRLLAGQFPRWAGLPLERVASAGTDHAIFHLGGDLAVRLPRIHWAIEQVEREFAWLPRLGPHLPVAVTTPVAKGEPADGYPYAWGVYRWLDGETPSAGSAALARDVAEFANALHGIDADGGPPGGRGRHVATRDAHVRAALVALHGEIDVTAAAEAWERTLPVPAYEGRPVWIHGDLLAGNLLSRDGRLTGVIDFAPGVGDPACDCLPAWSFLSPVRDVFRSALDVDDATWARGRGWALSVGLIALPYYLETSAVIVRWARELIANVLADVAG